MKTLKVLRAAESLSGETYLFLSDGREVSVDFYNTEDIQAVYAPDDDFREVGTFFVPDIVALFE